MKVFELLTPQKFEPKDTEESPQRKFVQLNRGDFDYNGFTSQSDEEMGIERLGSGMFGTAYSTTAEPGTAHKVVKPTRNLDQDGYFQFIKILSSHKEGSDNRFFPRIYDLEVYKSPSPETNDWRNTPYTYKVEMERLLPFSDLSVEEVKQIGNDLFTNFTALMSDANNTRKDLRNQDILAKQGYKEYKRTHDKSQKIANPESWRYQEIIHQALFKGIMNAMKGTDKAGRVPTNIKDPEFKRALMMLNRFTTNPNNNRHPDIHSGNIMVRRGPYKPQIVITDPVV